MTDKGMTGRRMTGKRMTGKRMADNQLSPPSSIRLPVIRLSVIRASSEPCAGAFSCSVCPKRPQGLPGAWHLQTAGSHEGARFRCTPDLWVSGG